MDMNMDIKLDLCVMSDGLCFQRCGAAALVLSTSCFPACYFLLLIRPHDVLGETDGEDSSFPDTSAHFLSFFDDSKPGARAISVT